MTEYGWETDEWPSLFERIIVSDILLVVTPIWLGEKSSIAKKLIERLDGIDGKTNSNGQDIYYGKVAGCLITGNEDGSKHSAMDILYSLQHLGYTIPPQAECGWIGEVGRGPNYGDTQYKGKKFDSPVGYDSDFTNRSLTFMTYHLMHLAMILKKQGCFPAYGNSMEAWENGEMGKDGTSKSPQQKQTEGFVLLKH